MYNSLLIVAVSDNYTWSTSWGLTLSKNFKIFKNIDIQDIHYLHWVNSLNPNIK